MRVGGAARPLSGGTGRLVASLVLAIIALSPGARPAYGAPPAAAGQAERPLSISASSAVLIDWASGRVLYAKDAHQPRPMASTTKIMTGLQVIEYGHLDEVVKVSRRAASTPGSSMYLRAGERISLERVLYGILMKSGNDATVAAAEHIAGSEAAFVAMMNAKARALGAYHTQFMNPHGLTAVGHYSTAYDLALMARAALSDPTFAAIVATREKLFETREEERQITLRNTNRLLWSFEGADGVKTGTTSVAGKCLVASATRGDERFIAVVLHSADRYGDAAKLLNYGFQRFHLVRLVEAGQVVRTVRVGGGMDRREAVIAVGDYSYAAKDDENAQLKIEWDLPGALPAPVQAGQPVGEIRVYVGDELREAFPLVARDDIPRRGLFQFFLRAFLPLLRAAAGLGIG